MNMQVVKQVGRPKNSVRTVPGMLHSFIKRQLTPQQLKKLYSQLTPSEQLKFLSECLPYIAAKKAPDSLSSSDIDRLYDQIMKAIQNPGNATKTG